MQNQNINSVKKLTLSNAILTTIAIVPVLGAMFANYGGFIAIVVLAVLILVKQKDVVVNKVPNFLAILGSIGAVLSMILSVTALAGMNATSTMTDAQLAEMTAKTIPGVVVGFVAWVLFLVAMIMYWVNFKKLGAMTSEV